MSKWFSYLECFSTKQINILSLSAEEVTTLKNLGYSCNCSWLIEILSDFLQYITTDFLKA